MIPILKKGLRGRAIVAATMVLTLLTWACSGSETTDERARIVTSTSIIADLVSMVTGDAARVESLIPNGADLHDFEPSARDLATLTGADLVVTIGLGLEPPQLAGLLDETGSGALLELGPQLDPVPLAGDPGVMDPHIWLDPVRMAEAVELIAKRIEGLTPGVVDHAAARTELEALDATIVEMVDTIPADQRSLITGHDVFGYFAARYGFDVVGVIVAGGDTLAAPSSRDLVDLIDAGRSRDVSAIFVDSSTPIDAAETVAAGIGPHARVVPLLTEALGEPGSSTETYVGMMRHNAESITEAMGGQVP